MVYDPNSRDWAGSASIKGEYNLKRYQGKHKKLLEGLARYTNSLKDAVVPFCEAFRPSHSDAFSALGESDRVKVRSAGEKLRRIRVVAPFLPVLIACRLKFPTDHAKYLDVLRVSEIFAFRVYRIMQKRADAGQATLFQLGHGLYHNKTSFDDVLFEIRRLALYHCSNETLAEDCALDDVENDWYSWSALKYVLYEYEEHLAGNHGVKVSWDVFDTGDTQRTIEHILPQTAETKFWRERFDRQQRRRFTHDIGNLCLTEDNSAYGNKPFPEKKGQPGQGRCYSNSNLFQERELAQYDDWTEESLVKRRKKFIKWYLERWHLDDSDISEDTLEPTEEATLEDIAN
jgi:hypothetical protein